MTTKYTRTGVRRSGDDYQDVVALQLLVEMLEHPDRYDWVEVEADNVGFLDDVKARKRDGGLVVKQVKFAAHPDNDGDPWTWEDLLKKTRTEKGYSRDSLVEKWSASVLSLLKNGAMVDAAVVSNRRAGADLQVSLTLGGLVDLGKVGEETRDTIIQQCGSEEDARLFFSTFKFLLDQPNLEDFENATRQRFHNLAGTATGWQSLKDELRGWVRRRFSPEPDGHITLTDVRNAALWRELQTSLA